MNPKIKIYHKVGLFLLAIAGANYLISGTQVRAQEASDKSANVTDLGFKYEAGKSRLEIEFDKEVSFEKKVSETDKQVILDIKNSKISKKWARRIDTSQHRSNVSLISPYQATDVVRVVLQLKDNGGVEITQDGKKLVAYIDNKDTATPAEEMAKNLSDPEKKVDAPDASKEPVAGDSQAASQATPATTPETPSTETPVATTAASAASVDGTVPSDTLDSFFQSQKTKNYAGKKIDLQLRDAELLDAFHFISESSEFNIVLSDNVKGKVTINLNQVPWDQALDLILQTHHLAAERYGNVLRVTTIDALTKEKEADVAAKKAAEAAEPMVVKIFPVSYAKINELKTIITDFLSKEVGTSSLVTSSSSTLSPFTSSGNSGTGSGSHSSNALRGSIQIDSRTNSLIVRDTPSTMEKIKRILKELDTQTPQILIETKFVEVTEKNSKTIEGRIFATSREFDSRQQAYAFNNKNNSFGAVFDGTGAPKSLLPGFAITPVAGGASFGFSPKASLFPGIGEIGAFLSILETEENAKVIASPRIVTQNKELAEISQGQVLQIPTAAGANSSGGFQTVNVTLKLSVTPQVTNDGNITLKLSFNQDALSAQQLGGGSVSTDTKKVDTQVMVDSGATLVIGGIYSSSVNHSEAGIPILRELPIIGALFGSKGTLTKKNELFIFLTPRILNDKESGIRG